MVVLSRARRSGVLLVTTAILIYFIVKLNYHACKGTSCILEEVNSESKISRRQETPRPRPSLQPKPYLTPSPDLHSSGDPSIPIDPEADPLLRKGLSNVVNNSLKLTDEFKAALETLAPLPKQIHLCWSDKNVINMDIPMINHGVGAMAKQNPDWKVIVWNDTEIETYIREHLERHDYDLIKDKYIVEKTDLWRLLVLYHIGGIYSDLDRSYNKGPISGIINATTKVFLPTHVDINFAQDLMITSPANPVFKTAIENNLRMRRYWHECGKGKWDNEVQNVIELGPHGLFAAATYVMFGRALAVNLRDEHGNKEAGGAILRRAMTEDNPYMQSFREHGDAEICDLTFWYTDNCRPTWARKGEFLNVFKKQQWDLDVKQLHNKKM